MRLLQLWKISTLLISILISAGCATLADYALVNDPAYQEQKTAYLKSRKESPPGTTTQKETKKFLLQFFHFNVEYMAGDRKAEDAVIRESFWPVVVMLLKHPEWGADLEMQGYMIEVMAERHPDVLQDLQTLTARGKVKLISFHYSDQLVVAFPRHDQEWSWRLNQEVFAKYNLPLSSTFFLQEDQFGEGILEFAKSKGLKVATTNYYHYFQEDPPPTPFIYEWEEIIVVPRRTISQDTITAQWSFNGDGELLATGESNPYLPILQIKPFRFRPEVLLEYEQKLTKLEQEGYAIVTIEDYVERLKELGVKASPLRPILDSLRGDRKRHLKTLFLWLGRNVNPAERDVEVRSHNFQTRKSVLAAETFINVAANDYGLDVSEEFRILRQAWKAQLRAEVSDSTGTVPLKREVRSSYIEGETASLLADKIIARLKNRLGWPRVLIDALNKTAVESKTPPPPPASREPCTIPLENISAKPLARLTCLEVAPGVFEIDVRFFNWNPLATIQISFPRFEDAVIYSPALMESDLRRYELSLFAFEKVYLGLPNGLIGLGRDWYVIKHNEVNHTSALVDKNDKKITFLYQWPWRVGKYEWKFTLVNGPPEKALLLANKINVYPSILK